jgi:hypothetical protein
MMAGYELGRFATREAAELVARAFARRRNGVLVVHLPDGKSQYESFEKGWLARRLAR